jgi:Flp pilus assembly pilin Flp
MQHLLRSLWRDQRGQDLLEYVLLAGFAATAALYCLTGVVATTARLADVMRAVTAAISLLGGGPGPLQ